MNGLKHRGERMNGLKLMFAIFAFSMLTMAQGTDDNAKEAKNDWMVAKGNQLECRATFYTSLLSDAKEFGSNVSIDEVIATINGHVTELKAAAANGDRKGFVDLMASLSQDSKDTVMKYTEIKKEIRKNKELHTKLRESFVEKKQEMSTCLRENALQLGKAQADYITDWRAKQLERIKKLQDRGVDTSSMSEVLSEADEKASELNDAVSTGDGDKVIEKEKEIRQQHLHIWARYNIAQISAVLARMTEPAKAAGLEADVNSINALLTDASAKVKEGIPYEDGEFQKVVSDLKDAAKKLRELYKKLVSTSTTSTSSEEAPPAVPSG